MAKLKVGVLISGRGSNMAALIAAARTRDYPADIACVISNVAGATGVVIAREAGIAATVIPHRAFPIARPSTAPFRPSLNGMAWNSWCSRASCVSSAPGSPTAGSAG